MNSSLVDVTLLSPNFHAPRTHKIDTITPHCVVGFFSAKEICMIFQPTSRQASCNYTIGTEGDVGLCVEEKNRSWCSSSPANDHRAITIECASGRSHPYEMKNETIDSLIRLCVDVCKRNDIPELRWRSDKTLIGQVQKQNITVHRWFANKSCPGDYLFDMLYEIADDVNAKLGAPKDDLLVEFQPFTIRINIPNVEVYKNPGNEYEIAKATLTPGFSYTIVEQRGDWGRLKSGAGWVHLNPISKIGG